MAFFLGIGTGGVFAWVALPPRRDRVGAVTGIVGAAGGLGGFFPPLVMGATYDSADNDYTTGLALLSLVSLLALLYTAWRLPGRSRHRRPTDSEPEMTSADGKKSMSAHPGTDGAAADLLLRSGRFFTRGDVSADLRTCHQDRWPARAMSSTGTGGVTTRWSGPPTG